MTLAILSAALIAMSLIAPHGRLQSTMQAFVRSRLTGARSAATRACTRFDATGADNSAANHDKPAQRQPPYRLRCEDMGHLRSDAGTRCQYGELPGRWQVNSGSNVSTWQTLAENCQLADRVAEYGVSVSARRPAQPTAYRLNLLLYGDSIDRWVRAAASSARPPLHLA